MYNNSLNETSRGKIRLLNLEPLSHSSAHRNRLYASLQEVDLTGWNSFDAVSYVWGTDKPKHAIQIGQVRYLIRGNCYNILLRLRHPTRRRKLWVDSICINQDDNDEKSHQVAMMFDIYRNANRVFIWLGEGTAESDYAIDWCEQSSDRQFLGDHGLYPRNKYILAQWAFWHMLKATAKFSVRGNKKRSRPYQSLTFLMSQIGLRRFLRYSPKLEYRTESIQDLFHREWFTRMWTFQEVAIARKPIFICGKKVVSWWSLENAFLEILSKDYSKDSVALDSIEAISFLRNQLVNQASSEYDAESIIDKLVVLTGLGLLPAITTLIISTLIYRSLYGYAETQNRMMLIIKQDLLGGILSFSIFIFLLFLYICRIPHPFGQRQETKAELQKNLSRILWDLRNRKASDARDKVFALYGIFKEIGIELDKPNYADDNVDNAYLKFTQRVIKFQGSLEILQQVEYPGRQGLPSWVPDWSVTTRYAPPYLDEQATLVSHFTINGLVLTTIGLVWGIVTNCNEDLAPVSESSSVDNWGKPVEIYCNFNGCESFKKGRGPKSAQNNDVLVLIPGTCVPLLMRARSQSRETEMEFQLVGPTDVYGMMEGDGWPPDESGLRVLVIV